MTFTVGDWETFGYVFPSEILGSILILNPNDVYSEQRWKERRAKFSDKGFKYYFFIHGHWTDSVIQKIMKRIQMADMTFEPWTVEYDWFAAGHCVMFTDEENMMKARLLYD